MTSGNSERTTETTQRSRRRRRRTRLEADDCIVVKPKSIRTAIGGTTVGNFMEWFDFGVYGYLAVTMTTVFTEGMDKQMGLLVTLLGFAVSFLVRPLGGMVLGPLGDKIGRQKVLFFTMATMATATALIGVLPTAGQVGLWVIIPLYLLKMVQGFSTGGEYAGATTYVSEFSPDKDRGYWSSWLDVGSYLGFAFGAATVAITSVIATSVWGENAMIDGGWRVPFLIAIPLGAVAIWFRMRIPETPGFESSQASGLVTKDDDDPFARHGLIGVVRHFWREILIGIAIVAGSQTVGYALTSFMPTYLEETVKVSNIEAAVATIPVLVVMSACLPLIGRLSDRRGRKFVFLVAAGLTIALIVPAFAIMQIGQMWAVLVALSMVALPAAFYIACLASTLPALFPTASRYGAMGLTFNLGVSLFGGTTPLFSQALIDLTGNSYMPAFYIMFFSIIAFVAVCLMRESAQRPLLGSFPTVTSQEEATELARTQDDNPDIDTATMPLVAEK
ncbi:MHS family proline/betaine transporter-like MFS transporter [Brevibacterium sanguinis]|uniref:MHS family proline/betaine transporter-like MFS transporter n=2 Tax=Brevibacterium TaxID=1696 RepID=A0A366IMI1_9MICO|nr:MULTISPECIES: MFS transporter [Brevibacterium]RBP67177.1 MHS family proline/betaine transporter-like MFS transporter [Brevibacterium sanguinis]RBP73702.1 MHS family proline/betaine transporter-like MFS transporter [Brevibacterium celere]